MSKKYGSCALQRNELGTYGVHIGAWLLFLALWATPWINPMRMVEGSEVAQTIWIAAIAVLLALLALIEVIRLRPTLRCSVADWLLLLMLIYIVARSFLAPILDPTMVRTALLCASLYAALRILTTTHPELIQVLLLTFLLAGVAQGVDGIAQVVGYTHSNHGLYNITGAFLNPGPFGGYIAVVWVVSAAIVVQRLQKKNSECESRSEKALFWVAAIAFCTSFVVLPASMSRTAWLAGVLALCIVLMRMTTVRGWIKRHWMVWLLGLAVVLAGGSWGAYRLKSPSADGRLLMWQVEAQAWGQHPLFGSGAGSFPAQYAAAQRDFFQHTMPDQQARWAEVAGAPEYAFNEYLRFGVEFGAVGVLLLVGWLFFLFRPLWGKGICALAVGVGGVALLIFAMASYPFALWSFCVVGVAFAAVAATLGHKPRRQGQQRPLVAIGVAVAAGLSAMWVWQKSDAEPHRQWYSARMFYQSAQYAAAAEGYAEFYPDLRDNPRFLFEYGRSLVLSDRSAEAIVILERGVARSADPMFDNVLGNAHKATGDLRNAEASYRRAYATLPARIYPLYLLFKLYIETDQPEKARSVGEELLSHRDKIPSSATETMRREVSEWLLIQSP